MKKFSGYTLLELLITVALVAVIMAIGAPAMSDYIQNDRLITQINTLTGHMAYARSEAVKRTQQVSVCISTNGTSCTAGNWEDGWLIYVDEDGDGSFTGGEEILRTQQTLKGGNTLAFGGIGPEITYDFRGYVNAASIGTFTLCDSRSEGRAIAISTTGRVRKESTFTC